MSGDILDDKRVFTKAMADKSGFYADYNAKSGALGLFITQHSYPLSETDRETGRKLSAACKESHYLITRNVGVLAQSEADLYRPAQDRDGNKNPNFNAGMSDIEKESKFYELMAKQDSEIQGLMQRQAELDLKMKRLIPDPVDPIIEKAKAASVALEQKLKVEIPDFSGIEGGHQHEHNFHAEYRDATYAHSKLYYVLQNNINLGREEDNTAEMEIAAADLQKQISDYEKKYMGQEQFYKLDEEKRMYGATFTSRAYDADKDYAQTKALEDRILSGDMYIRDKEHDQTQGGIGTLRVEASSLLGSRRSYAVERAIGLGESMGFPLQQMIVQSTLEAAYKGVKAVPKLSRPTPGELQHSLNTLIVLLMIININANKENDPLHTLLMTMLNQELLQRAQETRRSQVLTQPGQLPAINAFAEQLGNDFGTKKNATELLIDIVKQLQFLQPDKPLPMPSPLGNLGQ